MSSAVLLDGLYYGAPARIDGFHSMMPFRSREKEGGREEERRRNSAPSLSFTSDTCKEGGGEIKQDSLVSLSLSPASPS